MGPRETFAFDKVLYREEDLQVTPSSVISNEKHIDIDTIGIVRIPPASKPPLMKPKWWQRISPMERTRARAPYLPPIPNLLIDVADDDRVNTIALHAKHPELVKLAISDARAIVY